MKTFFVFLILAAALHAQTEVGSRNYKGAQDATAAASTAPMKSGTSLPATCSVGQVYFKTDATAGSNTYGCTATNTWTVQGGGGTLAGDVNGSSGANTVSKLQNLTLTTVQVAPTGACTPVDDTGTISGTTVAALGATTSGSVSIIASLTGDFIVDVVKLRERTTFSGVTTLTASMGRNTNTVTQQEWIPAFSLMSGSAPQNTWVDRPVEPVDGVGNTYTMYVTFTSTGGNLSAVASGGVLVWEVKGCFLGVAQ